MTDRNESLVQNDAVEDAAQIARELEELDQALYHLNDMYGRALSVAGKGDKPVLAQNLLERSLQGMGELRGLLDRAEELTRATQQAEQVQTVVVEIENARQACVATLSTNIDCKKYNDDLAFEARTVAGSARRNLGSILRKLDAPEGLGIEQIRQAITTHLETGGTLDNVPQYLLTSLQDGDEVIPASRLGGPWVVRCTARAGKAIVEESHR